MFASWFWHNRGYFQQVLACSAVCFLSFMLGMQIVWPSLAIERLKKGQAGFQVTNEEVTGIVSAMPLSEFLTPLLVGFLFKKYGRRTALIVTAVIFMIAWMFFTVADSPLSLLLANMLAGLGCGIVLIIGPIYIAEISDKRIRGALISFFITVIAVGEVFSTGLGMFVSYYSLNLIGFISSILAFFSILAFATESPYYLLMKNSAVKAEQAFKKFRNRKPCKDQNSDIEIMQQAFKQLAETVQTEMKAESSYKQLLQTQSNIKSTFIVVTISIIQGCCGIICILTYASTTLPKYDGFFQPNPTMALCNILDLVFNLFSMVLIEKLGRKPLSVISNAGDALGTFIVGFYFYLDEYTAYDTEHLKWAPYVGILLYICFYGAGMATMPHVLVGELFPSNVRNQASVVSIVCIAISFFINNLLYFPICKYLGVSVMYFIFTFFSILGVIFSHYCMFETKGLSLSEIQERLVLRQQNL